MLLVTPLSDVSRDVLSSRLSQTEKSSTCMELGLDFEDEDFIDKNKTGKKGPLTSYNAKVCSRYWYNKAEVTDPETAATLFKFRGDNLFFKKNYSEAAECYNHGLENLPESNRCMRQDLTESLARCYMYNNKSAEALQLAHNLVEKASNTDMSMQALMLLQQIQHHFHHFTGEEDTLKQLLVLHPFSVQLWLKLADCYGLLYSQLCPLPNGSKEHVKITTCLVRARLLIRSVRFSVGSFIKEKYQKLLDKVDKDIKELYATESQIQLAKQHLGEDIFTLDQTKDEEDSIRYLLLTDHKDFDERWFGWNTA